MTATTPYRNGLAGILLAGLLLSANVGTAAASTAQLRVTRGAVEAIFEARTTANQIQIAHGLSVSAVRRGFLSGRISPFASGQTFCSADWSVLLVSFGGGVTRAESTSIRAHTGVQFMIDGQVVSTRETVMKRFLIVPSSGDFWGWTVGRLYAPGAIAEGEHTLTTEFTFDSGVIETLVTTFTVGSGSEFCG